MAIWESIEAMMEQMDGRDASWYRDDQVLTTTTATGLTVSFTVGYVSWLLRAGYLSASLMSVLPLCGNSIRCRCSPRPPRKRRVNRLLAIKIP
jgi:hypothetical protein